MAKLYIHKDFGAVPNELLNNPKISLKAKGLYAYLQSKPDGWEFSVERIASQLKEGRVCIRKTLQELEKFGYLQRKLKYDQKRKKINGYDYILYAKPILQETCPIGNQSIGFLEDISKKDNSKKDIEKKNIVYAKQGFATNGKEINELIAKFKAVNPTYERLFPNKSQREALERLVKKFGKEKVANMIEFLPKIFGKPYAPVITTPIQLEKKLADLIAYLQKERSKPPKVAKIR